MAYCDSCGFTIGGPPEDCCTCCNSTPRVYDGGNGGLGCIILIVIVCVISSELTKCRDNRENTRQKEAREQEQRESAVRQAERQAAWVNEQAMIQEQNRRLALLGHSIGTIGHGVNGYCTQCGDAAYDLLKRESLICVPASGHTLDSVLSCTRCGERGWSDVPLSKNPAARLCVPGATREQKERIYQAEKAHQSAVELEEAQPTMLTSLGHKFDSKGFCLYCDWDKRFLKQHIRSCIKSPQ